MTVTFFVFVFVLQTGNTENVSFCFMTNKYKVKCMSFQFNNQMSSLSDKNQRNEEKIILVNNLTIVLKNDFIGISILSTNAMIFRPR